MKRNDGWANLLTGLGLKSRDKKQNTYNAGPDVFGYQDLENMYRGDGIGKRIIDIYPEHMLKNWFSVSGDTENIIPKHLKKIGLKKSLMQLLKWERIFGGSVMVLGIDDGRKLVDPVALNRIKNLRYIKVYDRYRVDKISRKYSDPENIKYGDTEYYGIQPINGGMFWVHESRIVEMSGIDVPVYARERNEGWGDSVFHNIYESIRDYGSIMSSTASIVDDFITGKLNIEGLADMIAAGQEELIMKRLDILDNSRHIINTLLLDKEEKYSKETSNVSGLKDIIEKAMLHICAVSGIPMRVLFGEQSTGLSNKGEGNTLDWYDTISTKQEDVLNPILYRIIDILLLSSELSFSIDDNYEINHNPLWKPTMKEVAETRKIVAETDALYIDRNVLTAPEVTVSRFGGESYSIETVIETTDRDMAFNEEE